jgi:hypothetical protein
MMARQLIFGTGTVPDRSGHFHVEMRARKPGESRGDYREWVRPIRAQLKAQGWEPKRFSFDDDKQGSRARAQKQANAYADRWNTKMPEAELEVSEGFFL